MTIESKKDAGKLTLAVTGRLDTSTAPKLEKTLKYSYDGVTELVFDLKEDPVEQSGFVAVHQLWKDTVVLVDQSEAFTGSCFPVAFHQLIFCNAHVRTSIFFLGG